MNTILCHFGAQFGAIFMTKKWGPAPDFAKTVFIWRTGWARSALNGHEMVFIWHTGWPKSALNGHEMVFI